MRASSQGEAQSLDLQCGQVMSPQMPVLYFSFKVMLSVLQRGHLYMGMGNPRSSDRSNQSIIFYRRPTLGLGIKTLGIILQFRAPRGGVNNVRMAPPGEREDSEIMQRIIQIVLLGACVLLAACDKNTPLMEKVIDKDAAGASKLIAEGADVNAKNNYGWTALSHAARIGNAELVKLLLDHGADINARDQSGWTPLMRAAMKGRTEVVKVLLDRGAKINLQEKDGWTALHWAASRDYPEVVKLLLDRGADYMLRTKDGMTPLMAAMKESNEGVAQLIHQAGARD